MIRISEVKQICVFRPCSGFPSKNLVNFLKFFNIIIIVKNKSLRSDAVREAVKLLLERDLESKTQ